MPKESAASVPQQEKPALFKKQNVTVDDIARHFASLESDAPEAKAEGGAEETDTTDEVVAEGTQEVDDAAKAAEETPETETTPEEESPDNSTEEETPEAEAETTEDDPAKLEYPKFKARVDKLTAQKKELEAKVAELEAQQQSMSEAPPVASPSSNPFSNLNTLEAVRAEGQKAEEIIQWAIENAEGAVVKGKDGEETEYTSEEVAKIRYRAERAIRTDLPLQWEYVQQRQRFDAVAEQEFPWLKDKKSKEYGEAQQLIQYFPELTRFPAYRIAVGDLIEGRKLREAKERSKQKSATPKSAPKIVSKPVAAPKKVATIDVKADARKRVMMSGGSERELAKYFSL